MSLDDTSEINNHDKNSLHICWLIRSKPVMFEEDASLDERGIV